MKTRTSIFLAGTILAVGLLLLKFLDYQLLIVHDVRFLYGGIIALSFLGIGIYLAKQYFRHKTLPISANEKKSHPLLSTREAEILALVEQGKTNAEIADTLFVSVNTIKTHLKNIYEKLGVKSRAQAVTVVRDSEINAQN